MRGRKPLTTEQVIEKFKEKHKEAYIYDNVVYHRINEKVEVICPIHGIFNIAPSKHIIGQGCPKCGIIKKSRSQLTSEEVFIERSNKVHNNKYIYTKVYINGNLHNKVTITCPIHGDFTQIAQDHLNGHGCPLCAIENCKLTTEELIEKANKVHNNKYGYNKTIANGYKNEIIITCPIHGDFKQTIESHLKGSGCHICKQSHLENEVKQFLDENNMEYIQQKTFEWLRDKKKLHIDFYLPTYSIAIECQGEQHFVPVEYFGGEENLYNIIRRDELKYKLCKEHNIKVIYFSHCIYPYRYNLINEIKDLKEAILN